MDKGRIVVLVAMVPAIIAWLIVYVRDYRRCRGPKEKRFLMLVHWGSFAFLAAAACINLGTIVAWFAFIVVSRWLVRKQLEVRLFEGIEKGKHPPIPLS